MEVESSKRTIVESVNFRHRPITGIRDKAREPRNRMLTHAQTVNVSNALFPAMPYTDNDNGAAVESVAQNIGSSAER